MTPLSCGGHVALGLDLFAQDNSGTHKEGVGYTYRGFVSAHKPTRVPCPGHPEGYWPARATGTTLGCPDHRCLKGVPDPHTRPQILADQRQQPFIAHLAAHSGHQDVVLDRVEELRQV
ncbi:hypothetical protein ACI5FT_16450, partial [Ectothiorhodospira haloalkaliphila]